MTETLNDRLFEEHARQAVDLSLEHVSKGGIPFSALVIGPGGDVIGSGVNRVVADRDPLAHAEVVAMRDACAHSGRSWLAGCTLIASGEPCALCYYAALHFNVSDVFYVAGRHEAARYGFDYTSSYRMFAVPPEKWPQLIIRALPIEGGLEPFEAWQRPGRRGVDRKEQAGD